MKCKFELVIDARRVENVWPITGRILLLCVRDVYVRCFFASCWCRVRKWEWGTYVFECTEHFEKWLRNDLNMPSLNHVWRGLKSKFPNFSLGMIHDGSFKSIRDHSHRVRHPRKHHAFHTFNSKTRPQSAIYEFGDLEWSTLEWMIESL